MKFGRTKKKSLEFAFSFIHIDAYQHKFSSSAFAKTLIMPSVHNINRFSFYLFTISLCQCLWNVQYLTIYCNFHYSMIIWKLIFTSFEVTATADCSLIPNKVKHAE